MPNGLLKMPNPQTTAPKPRSCLHSFGSLSAGAWFLWCAVVYVCPLSPCHFLMVFRFRARKINYISIWLFGFIYPSYKVIIIFWLKKKQEIKLNTNEKYKSFIFWGALTVCSCFAISGKSSIYVVFKDLFIDLLN